MSKHQGPLMLLLPVTMLSFLGLAADVQAADTPTRVAGIMFDYNRDARWITVKADGEKEPVKYLIPDDADKALKEALKTSFNAARVQLTYKKDGDDRKLVNIKRQILKKDGTITGVVVGLYNNFWIEVKPRTGVADAFAPGGNFKDKVFMEKFRALKPGDSVTIKYTTDGERHRILELQKK